MKNLSRIGIGVVLGVFIFGLPSAHAVLGARLARKAIMAERAARTQKKLSARTKQPEVTAQEPSTRTADKG